MGTVYLIHCSVHIFLYCLELIIIVPLKSVSDNSNIGIILRLFSIDCLFPDFGSHFHISKNFGFYLGHYGSYFVNILDFSREDVSCLLALGADAAFTQPQGLSSGSRFLAWLPGSTTSPLQSEPNVAARKFPRMHTTHLLPFLWSSLPYSMTPLLLRKRKTYYVCLQGSI